jgi:hypothetical protein
VNHELSPSVYIVLQEKFDYLPQHILCITECIFKQPWWKKVDTPLILSVINLNHYFLHLVFLCIYNYSRIEFKILLLIYKSLNNMTPAYISDLLTGYSQTRSLRSANKNILKSPTGIKATTYTYVFFCCRPQIMEQFTRIYKQCPIPWSF